MHLELTRPAHGSRFGALPRAGHRTRGHGPVPPDQRQAKPERARGGSPRIAHGSLWEARTDADGQALGEHLLAPGRTHPVLVISTPSESSGPLLDAADLHRRVEEIADVVVLHTGPASWSLAESLPPRTPVYGGAGRVYPVDLDWVDDPFRAPLRFCWPSDAPARVADTLEDDVFAAAAQAGTLAAPRPVQAITRPAVGTVAGHLGRHNSLLRLPDGSQAIVVTDELVPGVEPQRLLRRGMTVAGRVTVGGAIGRFIPDPIADDRAARLAETYRVGDVVLVRVTAVQAESARGLLLPGVEVQIGPAEDDGDLRTLLGVDEVTTVEVLGQGPWRAVVAHADHPSVATASVLPDGPPWLTQVDLPKPPAEQPPAPETTAPHPAAPSADPRPAASAPSAPNPASLAAGRMTALAAERDDLAARLAQAEHDLAVQRDALATARESTRKLRSQLRAQKDRASALQDRAAGAALFDDPVEGLGHEIYLTWLRRVPPAQRAEWPLRTWRLGPRFLPTLDTLEGISRDKVLEVLVEAITGRARTVNGLELHPLRARPTGPQRLREDGARAWRCALQINTPSARRLHFWTLPDDSVELDQVGVHDDGILA